MKGIDLCFKVVGDSLAKTRDELDDANFWRKHYENECKNAKEKVEDLEKKVSELSKENDSLRVRLAEATGEDA